MALSKGSTHHVCVKCRRQFIDIYDAARTYSNDTKQHCLHLYVNGLGFRAIERVTGVHHTTVICWVKQRREQSWNSIPGLLTSEQS